MPKEIFIETLPGQEVVINPKGSVQIASARVAKSKLQARVITAGTYVEPEPPPVEPPPVEPPPPTQKIVAFPVTGTGTQFANLVADLSIDVIEFAAGTYPRWAAFLGAYGINSARPADRPLLVRPAPGAAVVWDGEGTINTPPWRIGWSALTSYITFDPAGTGGSFTAQNYKLGKAGVVMTRYIDHVTFNGLRVRNCEGGYGDGIPGAPQHTHAIYLGTDGSHRSKAWTSNNWDVVGPANRMLNGFHCDGEPSCDGVEVVGWTVSSLHRAVYAYADPTGVKIDGWSITDCNATIDNWYGTAAGVVANCHAVNAGPIAPGKGYWRVGPLADGGGNTSS